MSQSLRLTMLTLVLLALPAFAEDEEAEEATAREAEAPSLDLGGALRFNALYATWNEASKKRGGDFLFDTFRLNADAEWRALSLSAEYRFYAGYQMLHHGHIGYAFSDALVVDAGVSQVPFGLLPFASHNWFFNLPYYVGLEDDYDLGLRAKILLAGLDVRLAFYKNDEGSFVGSSLDSARYSYDLVETSAGELGEGAELSGPYSLREVNQLNARIAWPIALGGGRVAELGASGQFGGIEDAATGRFGTHWAAAAHLNLVLDALNVQLEGLAYGYRPPEPFTETPFVVMGAYDAPYRVARRALGLVANIAYGLPLSFGPLERVTLYENFSVLKKQVANAEDSFQNIVGAAFAAGPMLVYVDFALGRNHPFLGPDYTNALGPGQAAPWHLRLNTNLGWYF